MPAAGVSGLASGLTGSPAFDYIGQRSEHAFVLQSDGGPPADDGWSLSVLSNAGTPCANASDLAACQAKVDALRILPTDGKECAEAFPNWYAEEGLPACYVYYLVWTRGDEVGTAVTTGELRALMGTIDTIAEADFVLRTNGYHPACDEERGFDYTVRDVPGGFEFRFLSNCNRPEGMHTVVVASDGTVTETKTEPVGEPHGMICAQAGRRPSGWERGSPSTGAMAHRERGAYFALMAELESAAVIAFRVLYKELASLGAPQHLLARTRDAIRDEIRHARATRALAHRDGAMPAKPIVAASSARSVLEIALENAREGCVRETYGALLAWHQAAHAEDDGVRATMQAIADDETAHAALSWDVAEWLDGMLTEAERAEVRAARTSALLELAEELRLPIDAALARSAGLPSPEVAMWMLDTTAAAFGIAA